MDSHRPYGAQSSRDALVNAVPALFMFFGGVMACIVGVIEPTRFFSLGGTILLISAVVGLVVRLLIPKEKGEAPEASRGFDLVIFDCDGVLVDSEVLTVGVEARVLTQLGWPMAAPEVVRRWVGRSSESQLSDIAERLGPEGARRFDELTTREFRKAFERSLEPVTGVPALLDHLDDIELGYCVASSGTHGRIALTLGITGLAPRFSGRVYSTTDVAHGKPAPDLFVHAARAMGVSPGSCAVVEDSVYGVQAGVAAGMTVFGYAGGLTDSRLLSEAGATIFHEMSDLVGLLTHSSASKP